MQGVVEVGRGGDPGAGQYETEAGASQTAAMSAATDLKATTVCWKGQQFCKTTLSMTTSMGRLPQVMRRFALGLNPGHHNMVLDLRSLRHLTLYANLLGNVRLMAIPIRKVEHQ